MLEEAIAKLTAAVEKNTAALTNIGKAAGAKADATKAGPKATTKAKTDDEMRAVFGGYLASGAAEGKPARKANITAILGHYEVSLVTEIAPDKREAALADLKAYQEGGSPSWATGDGDEDDMLG